jgi:hypothetical protein
MKPKISFLSLAALLLASCHQTPRYELDGLANPLLDAWFGCFKAADSAFSAAKFVPTYFSEESKKWEEFSTDWYRCEPSCAAWYIFSPDSSFYLDLDFHARLADLSEDGVWLGGEPDKKVALVDVRRKKAIDIIPTNNSHGADDAFGVSDSAFVLLGRDYEYRRGDEEPYPYMYISKWCKEKPMVAYAYNGKIRNLADERFSPFFRRLQRLGVKYRAQ